MIKAEQGPYRAEKIYGVVTHCRTRLDWTTVLERGLCPSAELTSDLMRLKEGTMVGIEDFKGENLRNYNRQSTGIKFSFGGSRTYWDEIRRICKSRKLEVVCLDDFKVHKDMINRLANVGERGGTMEDIFKIKTETEYTQEVVREEKIVEKITKLKPEVVILAAGHADYLVASGQLIGNYERETLPSEDKLAELLLGWKVRGVLQADFVPDKSVLLERDLLVRAHRVVTEGRVMPSGKPDFEGTWRPSSAEGRFELFIDEENSGKGKYRYIRGTIEDLLGTADFEGAEGYEDGGLWFQKTYREDQSSPMIMRGGIYYEATKVDGHYEGVYKGNDGQGRFVMQKVETRD